MRRLVHACRREEGFSLVEVVIAIGIVTVIFVSLAYVLSAALRASIHVRVAQQGTALATKAIEEARNASYDALVMKDSDLAGDSNILPGNVFDPDASGPLTPETLVSTTSGGGVVRHITQETVGSAQFSLRRYVTWVGSESYKRYVVIVGWSAGGSTQTQRTSTLIARVRRGLGVPNYQLSPASQSKTVAAGGQVAFGHSVQNFGIVDTYDLQMPVPLGRTWTISFHNDVNRNGTYEAGTDTTLVDTNSNASVDTGSVASSASTYFLAVWTLQANESAGNVTLTMTATSGADSSVSKSVTNTLTVSGAGTLLYLHNSSSAPTEDTTANDGMPMNPTAPTATALYKFSTNYYTSNQGRFIDKSSLPHDENDRKLMANWVYQLPQATTFSGDVELKIYVAMKDLACDKTPNVKVHVRHKSAANPAPGTLLATGTATSPPQGAPCPFRLLTVTFPLSATVAANRWLELKLGAEDATGDAVLFAYDTTQYPSSVKFPTVSS